VPRVSPEERKDRDLLVLDLFVAGHPLRDIAARPEVNLQLRAVQKAIQRGLPGVELGEIEERYHKAYFTMANAQDAAVKKVAERQCRRLLQLLGARHPDEDDGDDEDRRYGELKVPPGLSRDAVVQLALKATTDLLGEREQLFGDIRLEEHREYQHFVEWSFSFSFTTAAR
jgi:hypothetical protein